jgi:putative hydrolase of the HAD superfamily
MNKLIQIIRSFSRPIEPLPTGVPIDLHLLDGIETVLFDVYGTLLVAGSGDIGIASGGDNTEALMQALIISGYEGNCARAGELGPALLKAEIEQQHEAARQNGIDSPEVEISTVWKKVIENFQALDILRPDDDAQKILRLAAEYECRVNPVWPMPGALETIGKLRARGFRLGIVSNAQFYTPPTLEALFGKPVKALGFDPALCVWSYQQLRSKPSVELFRILGKKIDLTKAVYVGNDMLNDIWTAAQAGCRTVLFAGDRRALRLREQDSRCRKLKPDAVIDDLRQLAGII